MKIFRKKKKNKYLPKKLGKYLIYALGEVIIVIIGILIAVRVDKKTETNKNLDLINSTIIKLESELLENYKDASSKLKFWTKQDKICKSILSDTLKIEDYKANEDYSLVTGNWESHRPKLEFLNLLIENEKLANGNHKEIFSLAKELKNNLDLMNRQWMVLHENGQSNIDKITQKFSIVKQDSISKEKKFRFMSNNSEYSKMVELYWIKAQLYYYYVSQQRALQMALLSVIRLNKKEIVSKRTVLEAFYKKDSLKPFKKMDCTIERGSNKKLRASYLIGNLSKDTIYLRSYNDGKKTSIFRLIPNEFSKSNSEFAGLNGSYSVFIEIINYETKECIEKYSAVRNGYLIIE